MPDIGDNTVYSHVDASNSTGTNPGWPEGMAPSRVNDAARALQGAVKRWRDYSTFSVTSGGVAATQTLTYAVAPSLQTNDEFGFIAGFIATAAMTLNINATGVKTVKKLVAGVLTDLVATDWAANDKVKVSYDGTFYVLMFVARISATLGANTFTGIQTFNKDIITSMGATVASAATTDIWTAGDGNTLHISGTATITSFGTAPKAGARKTVVFDGAAIITYNAVSMLLNTPSLNYTALAGDVAEVYADTTTNMRVNITRANGQSINWTEVKRGADLNIVSNTTPANDGVLNFPVDGAHSYVIEADIYINASAGGYKIVITMPGTAATMYANTIGADSGGTYNLWNGISSTAMQFLAVAGNGGHLRIYIYIAPNAAGTVYFQFAQNSSNVSATTIGSESYFRYRAS